MTSFLDDPLGISKNDMHKKVSKRMKKKSESSRLFKFKCLQTDFFKYFSKLTEDALGWHKKIYISEHLQRIFMNVEKCNKGDIMFYDLFISLYYFSFRKYDGLPM